MKIQNVTDPEFKQYGRIVTEYDFGELIVELEKTLVPETVVYKASDDKLEETEVCRKLQEITYGELPIQIGYCNGHNRKLTALEYHRSSEIDVAATDMILLLGKREEITEEFTYDMEKVEAFFLPKGCAVEIFATTLHYTPCSTTEEGFIMGCVLPKGTNTPLEKQHEGIGEDQLLAAKNKWRIPADLSI